MNKRIFRLLPKFIRKPIEERKLNSIVLKYYADNKTEFINQEKISALNYLKKKGFSIFPYPFQEKYKNLKIEVKFDVNNGLKYVISNGKRLYFKRKSSIRGIKRNYNFLRIEQDQKSPHRYLTDSFNIQVGDILVDVGAAEGNLTLEVIEKIKKAYIFETDRNWIEALKATFAPWKEKVVIINKFVSNFDDNNNICLDNFFKDKENFTFLKVDAEGSEDTILEGAEKSIQQSGNLRIALCCYHKPNDEDNFRTYLEKSNYSVSFANGYMIFPEPKTFQPPYLRRGVLRAEKAR